MFRLISGYAAYNQLLAQRRLAAAPRENSGTTSQPTQVPTTSTANLTPQGQLLSDLRQLRAKDPARLKELLRNVATHLQTASEQVSGQESKTLSHLATRFRTALQTGDLSTLAQSGDQWALNGYTRQGKPIAAGVAQLGEFLGPPKQTATATQTILSQFYQDVHKALGR